MSMKVQNNRGLGNPYHDEKTGEFTSPEYASSPGNEDSKFYDKNSGKIENSNLNDIDWDDLFSGPDGSDDELDSYWNEINGKDYQKNIEEMTNQELIKEINDCYNFFMEKGLDFSEFGNCFNGDLQLKCANFRQLKNLMNKYPIPLKGCKFTVNNRYHSKYTVWARASCIEVSWFSQRVNYRMDFNAKAFMNYKENKIDVRDAIKSGHWVDCANGKESILTISHEYGHMIQAYLMMNKGFVDAGTLNPDNFDERIGFAKKAMKEEIKENYYKKHKSYIEFEKEISKYGKLNSAEFFAETFASLMCGKPTKTALIMKEWLEKYF